MPSPGFYLGSFPRRFFHLSFDFEVSHSYGAGYCKGDQGVARGCYYSNLKGEFCQVVEKGHKLTSNTPTKLSQINTNLELDNQDQKKMVRISSVLVGTLRDTLIEFLV